MLGVVCCLIVVGGCLLHVIVLLDCGVSRFFCFWCVCFCFLLLLRAVHVLFVVRLWLMVVVCRLFYLVRSLFYIECWLLLANVRLLFVEH